MRNKIIYTIILLVIIAGIVLAFWYFGRKEELPEKEVTSFEECVAVGYPVMESYPRQCRTDRGELFVEDIGNGLEKRDLIIVTRPRPNQKITSPFLIRGEARGDWFFEASFPIELLDNSDNLIAQTIAQAKGEWMTEDFVPFEAVLEFEVPASDIGKLILNRDNPSGLLENDDQLWIPVIFDKSQTFVVKVYFNNDNLDPEFSCNKVFPVEREIPKTQVIGRAALEELLKGPFEEEKSEGFFTSINSGVKVQSLVIENGTARVDFDEQMEYQMGGSCRVSAIRAQIVETLKQFPTVDEVIISVNGRTEDILQP